jgi:two-component system sensor histidine kinase KdpD
VLVDELAHTNAPGSRHTKRYQDVLELLEHGIDVYTTLNVQHIESRADTVAQITGTTVRETVPDSILEEADEVEVVDIPPDELLRRLTEGKVYTEERSREAVLNFFQKGNLTALREMSLRVTAERVDHQLREYMRSKRIAGPWKSGQRLLVAISPSPHTVALIRWARRMAYTMDATWIAVYVETNRALSAKAREQLSGNIKLARELGAEIITTSDDNVATALVRVARQENVSQILVGKPGRTSLFRKSMLDRLFELSGDLDVYVVGGEGDPAQDRAAFVPQMSSGLSQYLIASSAILAVAVACYPFRTLFGYQTVGLIFLLAVALLPLRFGAGPVLLTAGVSALVWDFFFIPPQFTFAVTLAQDFLMLVTFFAISTVTGTLTARIRARERAVRTREARATALYSLTRDLSEARNQDEVAQASVRNIKRFFQADVMIFLADLDGDIFTSAHPASTGTVDGKEFNVAAWVYWNERKAGAYTDTLPSSRGTYYPVSGPRYPLGVIGILHGMSERMTIEQEALLENFIGQIASSLEREQLNELAKRSIASVEAERLYKTLFNSISHELRTPISAIISASESLGGVATDRQDAVRKALNDEIHIAAERLNRLVENLLDMTRLESGRIQPRQDWCDVQDLVSSSVRKLGSELDHHVVAVDIPDDMPLVRLDFGLIEQAITNLIHNAVLYTPHGSRIRILARLADEQLELRVEDNGPGFPPEVLPKIFEKFYRVPGTGSGGSGLGLSIVRGFVGAHGGSVHVENVEGGGARFILRLPAADLPTLEVPR